MNNFYDSFIHTTIQSPSLNQINNGQIILLENYIELTFVSISFLQFKTNHQPIKLTG